MDRIKHLNIWHLMVINNYMYDKAEKLLSFFIYLTMTTRMFFVFCTVLFINTNQLISSLNLNN